MHYLTACRYPNPDLLVKRCEHRYLELLCRDENSVRSITTRIDTTVRMYRITNIIICRTLVIDQLTGAGYGLECKALFRRAAVLETRGETPLVHVARQLFPGPGYVREEVARGIGAEYPSREPEHPNSI